MSRFPNPRTVAIVGTLCLVLVSAQTASAQRRGGIMRLFGVIPSVTLAQLEEVQAALALNDEQKRQVVALNQELNSVRRDAFQSAAGDFAKMRADLAKIYADFTGKFNATLNETQQQRAQELYVQINGPVVLNDPAIRTALQVSEEQQAQLDQALEENRTAAFAAFQDLRDAGDDERAAKVTELIESRDKSLLAVLTEAQQEQFTKMQGEKLEVDLSKLPGPGQG
jgi:hypothetical protein